MHQFTVCVADDCIDEAAVLCEGLQLHDYGAVMTHNGQDTVKRCARGDIDLLLLDIGLPDIDGYEVCRRLKSNPETRDIPIIFVTARGEAHDVEEGYLLGAVDYIPKPYNLPMVMVRVDSAIRTRQLPDLSTLGEEYLLDTCFTDQLTGLKNKRFLMERLQEEVEKARRYKHSLACVLVDVDEVMAVDDDFGTAAMDDMLFEIGMVMRHCSRNFDIVARYDASVFAALLPHASLSDAMSYANKLETEVESMTFSDPPSQARLTLGVVASENGNIGDAEELLGEAMRGLFQAKSMQGERVVARSFHTHSPEASPT